MFVLWDDQCQSVESGEDDTGWPTFDAALSACSEREVPAYINVKDHLVFGDQRKLERAQAADVATARCASEFAARQAATVASIAAQAAAAPAPAKQPDRMVTLAKMLASNEAALAAELAKRKADKGEIARLRDNCERLRGDLGIMSPGQKLLTAIFG